MRKLIIELPDEVYDHVKDKGIYVRDRKDIADAIRNGSLVSNDKPSGKDTVKFYYVESLDEYWIGKRLDNMYYAEWQDKLGFVWTHSKYLPWGEHVKAPNTLWKEYTYPSEPREIPFTEWIKGFTKQLQRKSFLDGVNKVAKELI